MTPRSQAEPAGAAAQPQEGTPAPVRRGVRVAVDIGMARVGVARTDPEGIMALPVATIARDVGGESDMDLVLDLVAEHSPIEVLVGLPLSMDGGERTTAKAAKRWAGRLATALAARDGEDAAAVRMVDERLSTVSAHRMLHEAGRAERGHRAVVDQVAAVVILESALEVERRTGNPAGTLITPREG